MSLPHHFVQPAVTIGKAQDKKSHTSPKWSGADLSGNKFRVVQASWIVPSVYPPESARSGDGWTKGKYECGLWVGIDGHKDSHGKYNLIQAGTASRVTVSGDKGDILDHSTFAWFQWFTSAHAGDTHVSDSDFPVCPGDTIFCAVHRIHRRKAKVQFYNLATEKSWTTYFKPPNKEGSGCQGRNVQWILEVQHDREHSPDYGSTFFYDVRRLF